VLQLSQARGLTGADRLPRSTTVSVITLLVFSARPGQRCPNRRERSRLSRLKSDALIGGEWQGCAACLRGLQRDVAPPGPPVQLGAPSMPTISPRPGFYLARGASPRVRRGARRSRQRPAPLSPAEAPSPSQTGALLVRCFPQGVRLSGGRDIDLQAPNGPVCTPPCLLIVGHVLSVPDGPVPMGATLRA
jgi:hypothetical protein